MTDHSPLTKSPRQYWDKQLFSQSFTSYLTHMFNADFYLAVRHHTTSVYLSPATSVNHLLIKSIKSFFCIYLLPFTWWSSCFVQNMICLFHYKRFWLAQNVEFIAVSIVSRAKIMCFEGIVWKWVPQRVFRTQEASLSWEQYIRSSLNFH